MSSGPGETPASLLPSPIDRWPAPPELRWLEPSRLPELPVSELELLSVLIPLPRVLELVPPALRASERARVSVLAWLLQQVLQVLLVLWSLAWQPELPVWRVRL